ncbi:VTT domain-containing protein [Fontimonas sp. SYSU GA230001]|uniref:VTT domain-containing protein n=1 Tax=Fontimonas sp. SYSU GA230001 TaxID=3142450 RepID=UPI0032B55E79
MIAALQQSLDWIHQHPHWALILLFVAAFLDSLFIIGAFVPAGVALFAAGALVALGSLELWQAVVTSAAAAVIGDSLSFWLGRRYGERLFRGPLMRRYPEILLNGRRFFERHGAFSVALARFLGPMRAIVPSLAGAAGLGIPAFITADVISACAWAFLFVIPGVAFGASLGLAAEVAGRLAILLLVLLLAVTLTVWLSAAAIRGTQRHAEAWIGRLLDWSRRHRRLGKFGAALADPAQPETPVLAFLAVVLLVVSGLGLWLAAGSGLRSHPWTVDAAVFQSLRDLHSPWGLALAHRLLQLGTVTVYAPVAVTTFVCLIALRAPRAAAHWVAAIGLAALLTGGLRLIPTLPPPHAYFDALPMLAPTARDLVLTTAIYAFLPVLLATGRSVRQRRALYGTAVVVLMLVLLARLYVGAQWFSVELLSVVVGSVWAGLLGLGYRRHRPDRLPTRRVVLPVAAAFLAGTAWVWSSPPPIVHLASAEQIVSRSAWLDRAWQQLPRYRVDFAGRIQQPLNLQWAGDLDGIAERLSAAGWTMPPALGGSTALRWLTREGPVAELPILPQLHAGRHPALSMRRVLDDTHEDILRLWPSGLRLGSGEPVWIGTLTRVAPRSLYTVLRYPVGTIDPPVGELLAGLSGVAVQARGEVWLLSLAPPAAADAPAP